MRLTIADEQAERERVAERKRLEVGGGRPGCGQVPPLERSSEDRIRMPLTGQGTYVRSLPATARAPLRAALFARCRRVAELARGAAGAKEHDLVLSVVVEVDQVSLPPGRGPG